MNRSSFFFRARGRAVLAVIGALAVFSSTAALAHPGHSLGAHGAVHALTSVDHASLLLAAGIGLGLAARLLLRRDWVRRTFYGLGAVCALVSLLFAALQ